MNVGDLKEILAHPSLVDDQEVWLQIQLPGPDAWSHHTTSEHDLRPQPDGSIRVVLVSKLDDKQPQEG